MVAVAAELGEVEVHHLAEPPAPPGDGPKVPEGGIHLGRDRRTAREPGGRLVEGLRPAVEAREATEPLAPRRAHPAEQLLDLGLRLALQGGEERRLLRIAEARPPGETPEHPEVAHVDVRPIDPRAPEHFEHQIDRLDVALHPGMSVDFRPHLDRTARPRHPVGAGVQHRARVAEPDRDLPPGEPMGVDPGHLGRHVRPHPEHPSRRLVGHLEGPEVEIGTGAVEQGIEVLEEGGHHELVAPGGEEIDDRPAERLEPLGVRGKHLLDSRRKEPRSDPRMHRSAAEIQENDPGHHAREARDPQGVVAKLVQAGEQSADRGRTEKGHDAFQDEQERDRVEQIAPHLARRGYLTGVPRPAPVRSRGPAALATKAGAMATQARISHQLSSHTRKIP